MAHMIHAKNTKDGLRFKVWSTITDSYHTKEMTEEELRLYTLKAEVCEAIERHNREINDRVRRASIQGTSSQMGDTRDLNSPWDKERR